MSTGSRGNISAGLGGRGSGGSSQHGKGRRSQQSRLPSDRSDNVSISTDVAFDSVLDEFLDAFGDSDSNGSTSQESAGAGALKRIVRNAPRFYYPGDVYSVPGNSGSKDHTVSELSFEDEESGTLGTELTGTDNLYDSELYAVHSPHTRHKWQVSGKSNGVPRTRIEAAIETDKMLNEHTANQMLDPIANEQEQNALTTCARFSIVYVRSGCAAGLMLYAAIVMVATQTHQLTDSNASLLVMVSASVSTFLMTAFSFISSIPRSSWLTSKPNVTLHALVVCGVLATVAATIASVAASIMWKSYEVFDFCTSNTIFSMPELQSCDIQTFNTLDDPLQCQGDATQSSSLDVDPLQPGLPVEWLTGDTHNSFTDVFAVAPIDTKAFAYENYKMTGSIPTEIGGFLSLESVVLTNNSVSGSLPTQIGRLSQLTTLRIRESSVTSHLPTELGMLTALDSQLELTRMAQSQLPSTIPTQLGLMANMAGDVDLSLNALTSTIPTELGKLDLVSHFSFSFNALCGEVPTELTALSNKHSTGELFSFDALRHSGVGTACENGAEEHQHAGDGDRQVVRRTESRSEGTEQGSEVPSSGCYPFNGDGFCLWQCASACNCAHHSDALYVGLHLCRPPLIAQYLLHMCLPIPPPMHHVPIV